MSELTDFDDINFEDDFVLPESEEMGFLDKAIDETNKIEDELQSTIDYLQQLSLKFQEPGNYLLNISPGNSWKEAEYLKYNVDSVINEERQNYDLNLPQQHHKAPEINECSGSSSSLSKSNIINHLKELGTELNIDDDDAAGGDCKPLNLQTELLNNGVNRLDFIRRHSRLYTKKIKIERSLTSAMIGVDRAKAISATRTFKTNHTRYKMAKETPLKKMTNLSERSSSSYSSNIKESTAPIKRPHSEQTLSVWKNQ